MRYWGILVAKVGGRGRGIIRDLDRPEGQLHPSYEIARWNHSPFTHDLNWTTMVFLFNLLVYGVLFLIVWDQRYRCRTCGRRLRMPVQTGRYAQMLLHGRPKLEYICTYGHGTLKVSELQFSGKEPNDWQPNDDMWKELTSIEKSSKE